jgi:tRNA(Ile)-lysidine synthase
MADRLSSAAKSGPELPTSLDGTAGLPVLCSEGTPGSVLLRVPGRTVVDSLAFNGTILDRKAIAKARLATTSNWDAYLDAKVGSDFEVRRWHPGDRMTPIGSPGSRKLQNVFVDRRVPRSLRARLPVVTAGDGIVWVPGVAVDVHAHVTDDSMRVVHIGVRTAETASDQEAD